MNIFVGKHSELNFASDCLKTITEKLLVNLLLTIKLKILIFLKNFLVIFDILPKK